LDVTYGRNLHDGAKVSGFVDGRRPVGVRSDTGSLDHWAI